MIASTQTNHPLMPLGAAPAHRVNSLDEACSRLKKSGLRITQPRVAIIKAMIALSGPASIEQIHQKLNRSACDLVTVYRCLAAFEEIGLVRRSFYPNGTSLYQIEHGDSPDYHVIGKQDKSIQPLPPHLTARLVEVLRGVEEELRAQGYTDVSHSAEFFANPPGAKPAPDAIPARDLGEHIAATL